MKVLNIKLNGKTYLSTKITMHSTKEALRIQRDAIALGKRGQSFEGDTDGAEALMNDLYEINDRKVNLVCEVFGGKFTPDELERALSSDEIDTAVNEIISGVSGTIEKN
jgi:hypothetical protein